MISWASMILSKILIPFTNPDWLGEIKEGRVGQSLFLISLEMILLVKFLTLICLYSVILIGLCKLGSSTIEEWVKYLGTICPFKNACTTPIRSLLIICKNIWKKYAFIQSGPTTELGFNYKTTPLSLSILGILVSWVFWSWLIIHGMHSNVCSLITFYSPLMISLRCSQAT